MPHGIPAKTRDELLEQIGSENGQLPAFAWPGGYPLLYFTADGGVLCPGCANGANGSEACNPEYRDDKQWQVVAFDVYYEGPPQSCDHCGAEIESAYGDPGEGEQ